MQQKLVQNRATARAEPGILTRNWEWLAIAAIALGAFAIRAWTARLNLPYVDHPDEPNPINYVVGMLRTGDPNPHFFQKPSLYVYLLLAVLSAHYRWGLANGLYGPLDQMTITTHLYTTIPGFFFWGRMLTATLGALTVASVFMLGRRVWSRGAGLIAALFLAVSPFHMRHSQYVTTDVATAWLVLLAFGACVAVARGGRWRDYLAAGAFVGLAASTKYNAGVAALMVCAAYLLFARRAWLARAPRLVAAGGAAVLGFVAGTPYAALSFGEFRRGLLGQVKDYSEVAHGDFTGAWNVQGYFSFFWLEGLGAIACIATLVGLVLLLCRPWMNKRSTAFQPPRRQASQGFDMSRILGALGVLAVPIDAEQARIARAAGLLWLSFVVPYLLLHMAQASHFNRNMVAVVVLCALPIGVAGAALCAKLQSLSSHIKLARPIAYYLLPMTLVLALLLPAAQETWAYSQRLRRGDTRVQAIAWIDAQVPPGVRVAAELRPLPGAPESRWAEAPSLLAHDLAWYRRQGYGYLVASSETWRQWAIPAEYRQLAGAPVAEFGGDDPRDMLGPHLAIYATGLSAADAPEQLHDTRVGGARLDGIAIGQPAPKTPGLGLEPARTINPGQTLALRTFWSVEQPFTGDLFIFVHLVDAAGKTLAQRDAPPWLGRFPTSTWRPGSLVVDVNDLPLPKELPPGTYTLTLGMFDPATGGHPPMASGGQPVGAIEVGRVTVKP
jgi:4-amino-4-deoxy-L-arabinose transferase-like glycosyltransferase